ncbi:membrane protein insertase YidC [Clostridium aestuarii]|uniref:Membrane protein insertase YidC n=1 Tax=Clostridium aestuarii TaxID=338193 RepID=A0ABT4D2M4_9CLOT|nr:membrane protein insertase YidC [Clostridium aestuarii]MCY6485367.1 membrane protein insertase YidC [Clostridium aestuarii]
MDLLLVNYAMIFRIEWLNNALIKFFGIIHNGIHNVLPNPNVSYGLTIIVVTIIIRGLLFPLNYKQIKSTLKMNEIQPEMKKLQERYKNNPQQQQKEMMKLYKEKGVNPMAGCLPLLLQWPILIALYYVFMNLNTIDPNIGNVTFLGLKLMATPTSNPLSWILPIASGLTTYLSSSLMMSKSSQGSQAKQTNTMNIGMSLLITYMGFKFTTALVIYWVTNNLFQIFQTVIMQKIGTKKVSKEALE